MLKRTFTISRPWNTITEDRDILDLDVGWLTQLLCRSASMKNE